MKNQFVYKRTIEVPGTKEDIPGGVIGTDPYTKSVLNSFDISKIKMTYSLDDGRFVVILDDLHERWEDTPKINPKTQKPLFDKKGQLMFERVKNTFQSEIYLSEEEYKNLLKLTAVNNYE